MLGDVTEPTAPFGLLDVQGDGSGIAEVPARPRRELCARRLRERARGLGVSAASLCHFAFAQVLGDCGPPRRGVRYRAVRTHARRRGRRPGSWAFHQHPAGTDPDRGERRRQRATRIRPADRSARHEHASLALAQRCSGVPAPAPVFSALLNYRHSPGRDGGRDDARLEGVEVLSAEERTNYPLTFRWTTSARGFC